MDALAERFEERQGVSLGCLLPRSITTELVPQPGLVCCGMYVARLLIQMSHVTYITVHFRN